MPSRVRRGKSHVLNRVSLLYTDKCYHVGGKEVYSGTWRDAPEDVKALDGACDWYILDSIEPFDIIMIA